MAEQPDEQVQAQNSSPAGLPAPTMDPSERANGGLPVASRTGTGPAGEVHQADESVWVVVAHGTGVDRVCDSLPTAKAVCEDALATLSVSHPIVQDWCCVAADGESIWVRYYSSTRWVDGRATDAVIEQRVTRQRLNTTGKWFEVADRG